MGLVIVIVVGAILGWLAAIVIDRGDRVEAAICVLAGTAGSVAAAVLAGDVHLAVGVSAEQLLWGVAGGALAIVAINAAVVTRVEGRPARFDELPGKRQHRRSKPF